MSKPWFRRRHMMTFPIHPMGWLILCLVFSTFGLWVAVDTESLVGPEWLAEGTGILFAVVLLGMAVALIAKTEKR